MAISYHLSYFGAFPGYQREITSIHVRDGIGGVRLFSTVTYLFVDGATRAGTRVSKIRYASVFFYRGFLNDLARITPQGTFNALDTYVAKCGCATCEI